MKSLYDEHVSFYVDFVDQGLANERGLLHVLLASFDELLGGRIVDARVLDLACGEGYLSRHLIGRGAQRVIGIDLSAGLIDVARARTEATNAEFRVDDAQVLRTVPDGSVDVVVSQMAMMDIADHVAAIAAVRRVLTDEGVFIFSLLHPALEGSPFHHPERPRFLFDDDRTPTAQIVARYATEGYWMSGGGPTGGVRGRMGSYHRMISTYVNDLLAGGFLIERLHEPVVPGAGLAAEVPQTMLFAATKRRVDPR